MKTVTVYTSANCSSCAKLKRFLSVQDISFREVSLEDDLELKQVLINKTGRTGLPQTNIDGEWVVGFHIPELMTLLNRRNTNE
ncbi:glutaredoxin family protein [Priestia koreensis]|uniref:Glutaredoxin n=1 Tax=Priestia koreensis TaxID=284581 RepID=A0A0M0KWG5_9BACI|nr:glutaredoxin family protein [Priestia koreensis]KOO42733.1 glutaredoxin [Priestia koreensis]